MSGGKSSLNRHKHFGSGIGFQYIKKDKISFLLEITGLDGVTECSVHEFGTRQYCELVWVVWANESRLELPQGRQLGRKAPRLTSSGGFWNFVGWLSGAGHTPATGVTYPVIWEEDIVDRGDQLEVQRLCRRRVDSAGHRRPQQLVNWSQGGSATLVPRPLRRGRG